MVDFLGGWHQSSLECNIKKSRGCFQAFSFAINLCIDSGDVAWKMPSCLLRRIYVDLKFPEARFKVYRSKYTILYQHLWVPHLHIYRSVWDESSIPITLKDRTTSSRCSAVSFHCLRKFFTCFNNYCTKEKINDNMTQDGCMLHWHNELHSTIATGMKRSPFTHHS